jgi:hypothetical protein
VVMTITSTAPVYSSQARPWQSPPFSRGLPIAFAALFGVVLLRRRSLSGALGGALVLSRHRSISPSLPGRDRVESFSALPASVWLERGLD